MLVTSYGIALETENPNISISDLFKDMVSKNGVEDVSKKIARRFYIDDASDPDFFIGLVVTIKDQKKFLEFASDAGSFKIKIGDVKGDNKLMEFNFFLVNKKNGLGIYQYYHNSCSPETFGSYLRSRYRDLSNASRDTKLAALKLTDKGSAKSEKSIRSSHRKGLSYQLLVRPDNIENILSAYKEIRSFNYEIASVESIYSHAKPLSGLVKKVSQRVSFDPLVGKGLIAKGIATMVPFIKPNTARVSVLDDEDEPVSVKLLNMPDNFGEQEFDVVAQTLNGLDLSLFHAHALVTGLRETCAITHSHIFMAKLS